MIIGPCDTAALMADKGCWGHESPFSTPVLKPKTASAGLAQE